MARAAVTHQIRETPGSDCRCDHAACAACRDRKSAERKLAAVQRRQDELTKANREAIDARQRMRQACEDYAAAASSEALAHERLERAQEALETFLARR